MFMLHNKTKLLIFSIHFNMQGVECSCGAEKTIHRTRLCIDELRSNKDFAVLTIDMRRMPLTECQDVVYLMNLPKLLPWASWCYSHHFILWHLLAILSSQQGCAAAIAEDLS